jgi:hypothetical protein
MSELVKFLSLSNQWELSICNICVKQKISVINETKQDEILLKPKVLDRAKLRSILWTSVKFCGKVCPTFVHFHWHEQKLSKFSQYWTVFPSDFNNIYLKYFGYLQNLTRKYKIL